LAVIKPQSHVSALMDIHLSCSDMPLRMLWMYTYGHWWSAVVDER